MQLHIIATGSKGNCYILKHNEHMLMLDCGVSPDAIYRAVNYKMTALDGCLCCHSHLDHAKSINFLKNQYVRVPTPNAGIGGHIKEWAYMPFSLQHDLDNVGFIIQNRQLQEHKICYITDTGYVKYIPQGISTYIIECNFIDELLENDADRLKEEGDRLMRSYEYHMSLKRLLSFLSKADLSKLENIILIHLSDRYSDENRMIKEVKEQTGVNVYVAHAGDVINLNPCPF